MADDVVADAFKSPIFQPFAQPHVVGVCERLPLAVDPDNDQVAERAPCAQTGRTLGAVGAKAYYFEDSEGGHGVSDALQRPELMALRMTFLIDRLMN
jgi:hypothetical protein